MGQISPKVPFLGRVESDTTTVGWLWWRQRGGKELPRVWLNTYWALHHIQGNKRYTMQWFYYPVHRRASLLTVQELTKNGESPIARLWPGGKSTWKYEMYWSGSCPHTVSTTRRDGNNRLDIDPSHSVGWRWLTTSPSSQEAPDLIESVGQKWRWGCFQSLNAK